MNFGMQDLGAELAESLGWNHPLINYKEVFTTLHWVSPLLTPFTKMFLTFSFFYIFVSIKLNPLKLIDKTNRLHQGDLAVN